jgi:hypothetical protein
LGFELCDIVQDCFLFHLVLQEVLYPTLLSLRVIHPDMVPGRFQE